ncbi:MAG: tetratricopeptide repeat protein [Gammaproteobacteria bacterium]|nr:tetratricopeptide repeat protein [Gammaproteobacteria bacterium]
MRDERCTLIVASLLLLPGVLAARDIHYGAVASDAVAACDTVAWRGQSAADCYREILGSDAAAAAKAEAAWALGDRQAANELFRAATSANPDDTTALVRWGDLYAASHQEAEALEMYREALAADPANAYAKLGAAHVLAGRFASEAGLYLESILSSNVPDGARVGAQLLTARIALENGDTRLAAQSLDEAEALIREHDWPPLDAHALRAALDLDAGVEDNAWIRRALDYNPAWGNVYAIPAHFLIIKRRYREGIDLFQRAVDIEPGLASAHEQLGINLLRDNQVSRARRHIEAAYAEDPFSPRVVNTLRLLDSFSDFRLVESRGADGDVPIILRLHKTERDVLAPYATDLVRESIAEFTSRYDFTLTEPVIVEMYPDHDDFAVRTAGMPGLGILGATFGYVIAMDSPSGRSVEEFQWGTTLWHEMAHVFTLEATDHRVPRWFSEGVSVYEEWRSGPSRGVRLSHMVLDKMRDDAFLPINRLDEGFIRPTYEGQVIVSYMQAGLICRFIDQQYGEGKLAAMLVDWRDGAATPAVIERVLGVDTDAFDDAFGRALDAEFGTLLASLDDWREKRKQLTRAVDNKDWQGVATIASELITLMPGHVTSNSPYLVLADAQRELGKTGAARATLETYWQKGGYEVGALGTLVRELRAAGANDKALAVHARINLIDPLNAELHGEYGELLLAAGQPQQALREFEVALALAPHDMATAWYRMAEARMALGEKAKAQANLLEALDIAPNFRPAQKLLLKLAGSQ